VHARETADTWATLTFRSGSFWSELNRIAVHGDYAYVLAAHGLVSYDISDPANPVPLGHLYLDLPILPRPPLTTAGQRVYFGNGGVEQGEETWWGVFDVADPAHPKELSRTTVTSNVLGLAVVANRVYVGRYTDGVSVYDVTLPEAPSLVRSVPVPDNLVDLAVDSGRLYATGVQLKVFDLVDPWTPTFRGQTDSMIVPKAVAVAGDYAYVGDAFFEKHLHTVDVSLPDSPQIVRSLSVAADVLDIALKDALGVAVLSLANPLLLDLSDPAAPLVASTFPDNTFRGVKIKDSFALLTEFRGLRTFSLATPPQEVGAHYPLRDFGSLAAGSGHLYVIDKNDSIVVVDAGDPLNLQVVGSIPGDYRRPWAHDSLLLVHSDEIVGTTSPRIHVYDVSDPVTPGLLSYFDASGTPDLMRGQDSLVFVETFLGIDIWNLADPQSPQLLAALNGLDETSPVPSDTLLYLARPNQIAAYSISDPTQPVEKLVLDSANYTRDLVRSGQVLVQIRQTQPCELVAYDVSDPDTIEQVGSLVVD
jgi:hypothetical protein